MKQLSLFEDFKPRPREPQGITISTPSAKYKHKCLSCCMGVEGAVFIEAVLSGKLPREILYGGFTCGTCEKTF